MNGHDTSAVVRPLPGAGLVARAGDLLLVCAEGAAGVEDLLGLVSDVAAAGGDGSILVRRVAALLANDFDGRFPACAVSGATPDGRLAVLVYGAATADVVGGEGDVSLAGSDAITSVTRLVAGPITAIRLQLPGAGTADPRSRLDSGVVPAAGALYSKAAESPAAGAPMMPPSAPAEPLPAKPMAAQPMAAEPMAAQPMAAQPMAPLPPPMAPPAPPPLVEPPQIPVPMPVTAEPMPSADGAMPQLRQPDPAAPFVAVLLGPDPDADGGGAEEMPAPAIVLDMRPRVLGVLCKNDHFNDPNLRYCSVCGISMAQQTLVQHEGPRPPLGVLLLDDGSTFRLDMDYVIGREPQQDPEVVAGTVRPLRVADADGVVSRRHARISLVGWDVHVVDLGSANGTYVQLPGDPERHQLVANQPVAVRPGTQVTIGRRWFRYESHRNP